MKKHSLVLITNILLCLLMILGLTSCKNNEEAPTVQEEIKSEIQADNKEGKRVYFAGPLFNQAERDFNLKVAEILEKHGYEVFLPQRDGLKNEDFKDKTSKERAEMIFELDRDEVLKADILFMVLDGMVPDEGACIELGIAYASGKRCYGLKSDSRTADSNSDLNIMVSECFIDIIYNTGDNEILKELENYLNNNEL